MKQLLRHFFFIAWHIFSFAALSQQPVAIVQKGDSILIRYQSRLIFAGKLSSRTNAPYIVQTQQHSLEGKEDAMVSINASDHQSFLLKGIVAGTGDAIACESEPRDAGLRVVKHVVGQSRSTLNNAVYDRHADWLFSLDANNPKINIEPLANEQFELTASGREIIIRFKPLYYQKHRGLAYFRPKDFTVWKRPVVGWCSWFAYFDKIKETDVKLAADVIGEKLQPFGLEYLQIDDGYQQVPIGLPNTWLQPNAKFPSGLKAMASYIKSKGLTPGIWTNVAFADSATAYQNASLFVKNNNGQLAKGNWVGYVMDGSNNQAIRQLISPVYKGLKEAGWQYYKLDALRHLKYEGYNSFAGYFTNKHFNKNEAFRNVVLDVRRQIGKDNFLLACWGIRPELVGIADGCRIGNDGYSYAGLAQFNSYNNIVWRNDPDHIELSDKEAFRSCVATSLTGSLFMLTDQPEKYQNARLIEAARRSIPVLYTQPGQVYDVDPSRSSQIHLADAEMSGSGPRPFDASSSTTTGLFAMEVSKSFENWLVLGRLDERDAMIPMKDLGLDEQQEYHVFEFWTKQYLGIVKKQFVPQAIDSAFGCQVFCFKAKQSQPQLLATNRHISCGGFELQQLRWKDQSLSGESVLVANDPYELYVYEPDGYIFEKVNAGNAVLKGNEKHGNIRKLTLLTSTASTVAWTIQYQ